MAKDDMKCLLVSDFNMDNFAAYLENDQSSPRVTPVATPYGQVAQVLMEDNAEWRREEPDVGVIWTQPQSVVESFAQILNYKSVPLDTILREVDDFCGLIRRIRETLKAVFVPSWVVPAYHRGYGLLDMRNDIGMANVLMRMNLRIADTLHGENNVYILNTQKWIEGSRKDPFNPELWYMAKIPFGPDVFKAAVADVKSALRGIRGSAKKLILLDLDDTLWGGIVGEVGWENITLGGHDHVGEAFVDFQRELKALTNRGVLLGIVSKNEESVALEAIEKHPEMVLKLDDFAGWKINWMDKAQNVVDLVSELNLGIDSAVFIDNNPVEQARVREAVPEVLVPEWPEDAMQYKKTLLALGCFDAAAVSKEDHERAMMYASARQRQSLREKVESLDEWLATLNTEVKVERLSQANLPRTAQLLNKTNQMNLSTRRLTEAELVSWVEKEGHELWTFRVSDKFGDSGLTGIISLEREEKKGRIVDFVLSCRVIGRKIEEAMIYTLANHAKSLKLEQIYAKYLRTAKNGPCLKFFQNSGFQGVGDEIFWWELSNEYEKPRHIKFVE